MTVWWPTAGFFILALVALGVTAGGIAIGKGQSWLTWLAGFIALALIFASGCYGRQTWIGAKLLPWIFAFSPYLGIFAFAVVMFGIYRGTLAGLPEKVSRAAVVPMLLAALWLLPSLAPLMPGGDVTAGLNRGTSYLTVRLHEKTRTWFRP